MPVFGSWVAVRLRRSQSGGNRSGVPKKESCNSTRLSQELRVLGQAPGSPSYPHSLPSGLLFTSPGLICCYVFGCVNFLTLFQVLYSAVLRRGR